QTVFALTGLAAVGVRSPSTYTRPVLPAGARLIRPGMVGGVAVLARLVTQSKWLPRSSLYATPLPPGATSSGVSRPLATAITIRPFAFGPGSQSTSVTIGRSMVGYRLNGLSTQENSPPFAGPRGPRNRPEVVAAPTPSWSPPPLEPAVALRWRAIRKMLCPSSTDRPVSFSHGLPG